MAATLPLIENERVNWRTSAPFLGFHLLPLLAVFTGVTVRAVVMCAVLYVVRMFFVTAGYHRYFAHRSYRVGRAVQFLLAFGGTMALQKGPLWWAAHHRAHHRYADTERDVHTPLKGFWHSHVGWIMADRWSDTDMEAIGDFAKFPELRFLNRHDWIGPWMLGIASFLVGGWSGLVVGFFASTVLLWHGTFAVNSLAHVFGRRRYATGDTSRNSLLIALFTGGEGWHNNHHHFPVSARQGFFWWEVDPTYYVLRAMSFAGLVHDLRRPPATVLAGPRVASGSFDEGMFRAYWAKATAAVAASKASIGGTVSGGVANAADSLASHRASFDAKIQAEREALQDSVSAALRAAEEYARAARRTRRELRSE